MTEIEQWADDKPLIIALVAPWVASCAKDLHTLFEQPEGWSILNRKLPGTDRSNWYRLYRSHHSTNGVLRTIFTLTVGEKVTTIGDFAYQFLVRRNLRKKFSTYRPSTKEIHFGLKIVRRIVLASFKLLNKTLTGASINPKAKAELQNQVKTNIEFAFFIKVTAPCWILYGMPPVNLYRMARQGKIEAIDKLLRLDSLMIHEPKISDCITQLHFRSSKGAIENILAAPNRSPDVRVSLKSIKYSIGGLISALSELIGQPLTAPQVRALFNAIVKDSNPEKYHNEQPEDLDFPESDDSFYNSIKRYQDFWLKMFHPDNTNFLNVREAKFLK